MAFRPRRAWGATAAALLVLTSGCGSPGSIGSPAPASLSGSPSSSLRPVAVNGVANCATVPTASVTGDRRGMPELTLPCLTSQGTVNLATLGGRPLLLNLWASWCDPCREEVPVLQSASLRYADRVTFVGVDTRDTPGPAAGLLRQFDVYLSTAG